jgi:molybdate transport system ATP-binding protein
VIIRAKLRAELDRFSVTALIGPSGSGKTTVLRCLAGLERPEQGFIRFADETWFDAQSRRHSAPQERGIGYLFQDYALFPHLSVEDNVGYGLRQAPAKRRERVHQLLDALLLAGLEQRRPSELSGGQQQRVALARALAVRPRLLLLDEPLSALDAPTRDRLRRELRRMLAEIGLPVVLVTHDVLEAVALADQAVVLGAGGVLQSGAVADVLTRPSSLDVAHIVGVETVLPAHVSEVREGVTVIGIDESSVRLSALVDPPVAPGPVYVCIRAEEVALQRGAPTASSARNQLSARVRSLARDGPLVRVDLDCGFPLVALLTRPACEELGLSRDEPVTALIKASAVHVFPR